MNAMMFDRRHVDSVAFDPGTLNAAAELVSTRRSRRPLVCQWQRTEEGRLACTWRQISPDEARHPQRGDSHGIATPDMKSVNETRKSNRRSEMTPRRPRALEIETHALSTIAGDAQLPVLSSARKFAAPSQTPSRAQAVTQWIAITLLLAGAGLELIRVFQVGSSGPL